MTEQPAPVGRPTRELVLDSEGIPAPVMIALEARAAGNSWKQSAEIAGVAVTSLREWRKHAIVRDTLNEMVRDKLAGATATLVDATLLLAKELISLAMDSRQPEQAVFACECDGVGVSDGCNASDRPIAARADG